MYHNVVYTFFEKKKFIFPFQEVLRTERDFLMFLQKTSENLSLSKSSQLDLEVSTILNYTKDFVLQRCTIYFVDTNFPTK